MEEGRPEENEKMKGGEGEEEGRREEGGLQLLHNVIMGG